MKELTRDQVQSRKDKAVRFVRDVLGDPDRAEEIAEESVEDYAQRRKFTIINPTERKARPMPTKQELEDQIRELEEENQELQDQLDTIADIVAPAEEDEADQEADEDEDDDEEGD